MHVHVLVHTSTMTSDTPDCKYVVTCSGVYVLSLKIYGSQIIGAIKKYLYKSPRFAISSVMTLTNFYPLLRTSKLLSDSRGAISDGTV